MKKRSILFAMMAFALVASCSTDDSADDESGAADGDATTLKVLTFEDADYAGSESSYWSSLIDSDQASGSLLYGSEYEWTDVENTLLHHEFVEGYYGYSIYGGVAISNYYCEVAEGVSYDKQLSIPVMSGNNDSENFAIIYADSWCPAEISFSDEESRVIDHLYFANTSYVLSVAEYGDNISASLGSTDWITATITSDTETNVVIYLAKDGEVVEGWNKCDLTSLGAVSKISISIDSSVTNEWGSTMPSYIAIDDIAVQF